MALMTASAARMYLRWRDHPDVSDHGVQLRDFGEVAVVMAERVREQLRRFFCKADVQLHTLLAGAFGSALAHLRGLRHPGGPDEVRPPMTAPASPAKAER